MSKRKHDDEGAEQPPFEEHSFEQVSETARMLYAERPFALDGDKDHEFDFLVSDAFDFLDKLHEPYARIAEWRRSATPETLKKFERERVRARQPFRRAVRIIFNDFTEKCSGNANANPTQTLTTCPGGQVAPQSAASGDFGDDFISAKWQANLAAAYVFPWDINLGVNLNARQGYAVALRDAVTGLNTGTVNVVLDPIGDIRFKNVYELDLRIAKDFRIMNRAGLTLFGELFNVPNQRTILQRETLVLQNEVSRSAGWRITEMQAPRVWQLGTRITY